MLEIILMIIIILGIASGIGFIIYVNFFKKRKKSMARMDQAVSTNIQENKNPNSENDSNKSQGILRERRPIIDSIKDFYDNFNKLEKKPESIVKALENVDYSTYDKGKLKDFFQRHGFNFEEREEIMDALYDIFVEKKKSRIIEKEIPHYRNLGWKDNEIKKHFIDQGYTQETIENGFKEFHKKNIYKDYVDRIVKHMKYFVLSGESDLTILKIFEEHGWPKEILSEALEKTKIRLDEERSIAFLEEEILKLILAGETKEKIAKVLTRRGWPEDELKKHYNDIKQGLKNLEEELEKVDINQYNLDKIRDVLKRKNWPNPIVEKTIKTLTDNVGYHRKLRLMKKEAFNLVNQGYNATRLKDKLKNEGWEDNIIKKVMNSINKELAAINNIEQMKSFNDHIFSKDEWHQHMTKDTQAFNSQQQNNHNTTDLNNLQDLANSNK